MICIYSLEVQFTWHEARRRTNLTTHGLDCVDAEEVFAGPTYTFEDDRFQYPEQRFVTLGPPQRRLRVTRASRDARADAYHLFPKGDQK